MMGKLFFFFLLFWNSGVWGESEGKRGREHIGNRAFQKGAHNAGLVLWFGLSSLSWAEEWKRLSTGMSGVPSNGAGRVTGQWERGLQSGGLIFSWWTQPPASQCSLIARVELTYGPCLEGPNDRTNSCLERKRRGVLDIHDYYWLPFFFDFISFRCGLLGNVPAWSDGCTLGSLLPAEIGPGVLLTFDSSLFTDVVL